MANYTQEQLNSGSLGEALAAGIDYTFTFATPAYTSQSVYGGNAFFSMEASTYTNVGLQGSSTNQKVGALKGGFIPLSNTINGITDGGINATFTFDVQGDQQGSGAQIALTATLLDGDATATITRANVIRGGQNFISGDGITISLNDIQAAGFTNATNPVAPFNGGLQMDLFPNHIEGDYISSDLRGALNTFTGDVSQSLFISRSFNPDSSTSAGTSTISFSIRQDVGSGNGSFDFTPNQTIPVNSYYLKSTGHMTLSITN